MIDVAAQIRQALDTARLLTHALQPRIPPIINLLELELGAIDGYSTIASGSDTGPTATATTSRTESAAVRRLAAGDLCPACDAEGTVTGEHGDQQCERCHGTGYLTRKRPVEPTNTLDELLDLALAATQIMRLLHSWCDHHGTRLTATDLNTLRCTNWRADDRTSCGNFATPRRHNNHNIDDGRCLPCGQLYDDLIDRRQADRARMAASQRTLYHDRKQP